MYSNSTLRRFERTYQPDREERAHRARGQFTRAFPAYRLKSLTVDQYVIGHRRPTFCDFVEAKTQAWAAIQGSTAFKFGIYFGKTRRDPHRRYRHTAKYGRTPAQAFRAVKDALLNLVILGRERRLNFNAIDANPLSQLFKAKILSLYYPDRFLNVCSEEHLRQLAKVFGFESNLPVSYYQHHLMRIKHAHRVTRRWSNPKFMMFLYQNYIRRSGDEEEGDRRKDRSREGKKRAPRSPTAPVNFEDIQKQRDAIGKAAEAFALEWEKERLAGAGLSHLVPGIVDMRLRPSYGYDLLSYSSATKRRYIEVKSVAKVAPDRHRFYLSDNEYTVSRRRPFSRAYFFYFVMFDGSGRPHDLRVARAVDVYKWAAMSPASYVVQITLPQDESSGPIE